MTFPGESLPLYRVSGKGGDQFQLIIDMTYIVSVLTQRNDWGSFGMVSGTGKGRTVDIILIEIV